MQAAPELDLWRAVLQRVLDDLTGYGLSDSSKRERAQADARHWINSRATTPGSFRWLCETLSLDPSATRCAILRRKQPEKRSPKKHSFRADWMAHRRLAL
jgi:hypothetical protein